MKKFFLKKHLIYFLTVVLGVFMGYSFVYALPLGYVIDASDGYSPIAAYVQGYSGFTSETKTAIHNACVEWNSAGAGNLVYRMTTDHSYSPSSNNYWIDDDKNLITKRNIGSETYAMNTHKTTQSFWGNIIYEADININMYYSWSNNQTAGTLDVGNVITHEIGHLLGLGDVEDDDYDYVTMYYGTYYQEIRHRSIESEDENGINAIY